MNKDIFRIRAPSTSDKRLMELYAQAGRSLDDLPYTEEFDELCESFRKDFPDWDQGGILQRLFSLRKAGMLQRGAATVTSPLSIAEDEVALLEQLVRKYAGGLGQRDRLPYSPEFDRSVQEFNSARVGAPLGQHAVWRLVARIAK
jgi:hypothetical protein